MPCRIIIVNPYFNQKSFSHMENFSLIIVKRFLKNDKTTEYQRSANRISALYISEWQGHGRDIFP